MGFLARIAETFDPAAREDRRARALITAKASELEAKVRTLTESAEMADIRLVNLWDRFQSNGQLLYPGGFPSDRKGGQDWPILTTEQDLRQMRSFSRLLCETNGYAIGFRDGVRSFVVGSGFKWQVVLAGHETAPVAVTLTADGEPDRQVDPDVKECQQVLDEFRRLNGWGDDAAVRAGQGLADWSGVLVNRERQLYDTAMEDGEAFVRLFPGDTASRRVPYLRELDAAAVTCPPQEDQQGPWSWGMLHHWRRDEDGDREDVERIERVHVADPRRPGELGEVLPASHVLHFKLNTKSTVKRGIPDFWPIEDELKGSRTLTRNMLEVSGILAAIAYLRQHAPATTADQVRQMLPQTAQGTPIPAGRVPLPGMAGADATRYLTVHQAGLIVDVSNQLQYVPGPINSGVPGFLQAQQAALRCVGVRWGCPEYFSGDASNANFASTLVAGGPFERATLARQSDYKLFQGQLAVRVLLFAVESGRLRAEQVARVAVKVTTPPVAIANRKEDTDRRKVLFDSKVLDPQTWIAEEGYDPAQVAANLKAWAKLFPDPAAGGGGFSPAPGEPDGSGGGDGGSGTGGGGDDPLAGLVESYTMPEYMKLSESARSGLTLNQVGSDAHGHPIKRWVRAVVDTAKPVLQGGLAVKAKVQAHVKAVGAAIDAKLSGMDYVRNVYRPLKAMVVAGKTAYLGAMQASQAVAVELAKARGTSPEKAETLRKALFVADFVGSYGPNLGAIALGTAVGLPAVGIAAGKVLSAMPTASVAYCVYAACKLGVGKSAGVVGGMAKKAAKRTLTRGVALAIHTVRQARELVAAHLAKRGASTAEGVADWRADLAAVLAGAEDADWAAAVFAACLDHLHDPAKAVRAAGEVLADHPTRPAKPAA